MPQENVEVVRAANDAWNRGDLDGALSNVHPDIEFAQDDRIPGAVSLTGRAAVRAWLESFQETWEWFRIVPERIEGVDGERVLIVARISAKGRTSQAEVEQTVGHVLSVQEGSVVRWDSYAEPDEAVQAAGRECS